MTPADLEERARQSGQTDLSGPVEIERPPRWLGVFVVLVLLAGAGIGFLVLDGIREAYTEQQVNMRPNP